MVSTGEDVQKLNPLTGSKPAELTLRTRLRSTDVFIVPRINETRPRTTRCPLQRSSSYASCWGLVCTADVLGVKRNHLGYGGRPLPASGLGARAHGFHTRQIKQKERSQLHVSRWQDIRTRCGSAPDGSQQRAPYTHWHTSQRAHCWHGLAARGPTHLSPYTGIPSRWHTLVRRDTDTPTPDSHGISATHGHSTPVWSARTHREGVPVAGACQWMMNRRASAGG